MLISFVLILIYVLKFHMSKKRSIEIRRSQGPPVDTTKLNAWICIAIPKIKFLIGFNFWWCFEV